MVPVVVRDAISQQVVCLQATQNFIERMQEGRTDHDNLFLRGKERGMISGRRGQVLPLFRKIPTDPEFAECSRHAILPQISEDSNTKFLLLCTYVIPLRQKDKQPLLSLRKQAIMWNPMLGKRAVDEIHARRASESTYTEVCSLVGIPYLNCFLFLTELP
jgi:hypothetical protein